MLFCKLVNGGKLEIKLPESVPSNVARSFSVLFPAALSVLAISAFGFAFKMVTGMTLFDAIKTFLQAPLQGVMTGLPGYLAYVMFANILWMFGIHGTQTLSAVASPILLAAFAENEAAYLANEPIPNIICTPFASMYNTLTGAGITGGMIIAIMLFSKREDYRQIAKLSIPCGIFNINEPMTFGIPIVLNPMFAVPFLLAPVLGATIGYILTKIGFCGRGVVNAPWTTPPIIAAFLDTGGSVGAAITQVLILAVSTLLYTPFIIAANSQTGEE
jgi:PTS system cellobiose-specific IIC component